MASGPTLLLIATGIDRRGAETHVLALARGLAARGWRVAVAYWGGSGELAAELRAGGAAVHRLPWRGKLDPRNLRPLLRLMRALQPDVVHTHLPLAELYGNLAAVMCGVRAIVSTKHSDHNIFRRPLVRLGAVALSASNGAVVAVSRYMAAFIRSVGLWPATPLVTIPNGVDLASIDRSGEPAAVRAARAELLGDGAHLLGSAGRLEPEKGFDRLIAAMPQIIERLPGARLAIAGGGSRRAALEAQVRALGLSGRVRLLGPRSDLPRLMHAFDLFVLPSRAEPFGLVLLEAMAARRPIVASAAGGVPEVVLDGQSGDLVPPGDSGALARAVIGLLSDRARADRYGACGRARAEQVFPIERMLGATERLYHGLLAGDRRAVLAAAAC